MANHYNKFVPVDDDRQPVPLDDDEQSVQSDESYDQSEDSDNQSDNTTDTETLSSSDESEVSDDDDSSDSETDPWSTLANETIAEHKEDMTERYRELMKDDMSKQDAYKQTCAEFTSELNASFRHRYIILLKQIRLLRKDPTYKKIDQTAKRMRLEDAMDQEESLEMAVKQRQVLLARILKEWNISLDSESDDDSDLSDDNEDNDD